MSRNIFAPTGFGPEDIEVKVSELLVATADHSDAALDRSISEVLKLLRERMGMDVVFVSEFTNGQRVFRKVEQAPGVNVINEGESAPLEQSWCQLVVDGRMAEYVPDARKDPVAAPLLKDLPFPIGSHLSPPLVLSNGEVYGTLCCFSHEPNGSVGFEDLTRLKLTARLAAQRLDSKRAAQRAQEQAHAAQAAQPPQATQPARPAAPTAPDWQLKPK